MFNPARVSAANLKKSKEGAVSTLATASHTRQRGVLCLSSGSQQSSRSYIEGDTCILVKQLVGDARYRWRGVPVLT